jgi:hypothetical protein
VDSGAFVSPYTSGANEAMISASFMRPWQEALREYIEIEWSDDVARHKE